LARLATHRDGRCRGSEERVVGRGRAKAKQVKVARRLKYGGGDGDLERLRRELEAAAGGDDASADRGDDDVAEG
jgi:hypothetical protein